VVSSFFPFENNPMTACRKTIRFGTLSVPAGHPNFQRSLHELHADQARKVAAPHFALPLCIDRSLSYGPVIYRQESSMAKPTDLVQGTLDLLILKTLALQPMHGWGIAQRIRQVSQDVLQVNQGALYPALHRLEQQGWIRAKWGESENNRRAKFYSLTPDGAKYLRQEQAQWKRLSLAIELVLETP
jgi:PadR family transcriptional regulator PadR